MSELLFEIGCEELPASFVDKALQALPSLVDKHLSELRLSRGEVTALGTPRRLTVVVRGLSATQSDVDEVVKGPPENVAFKDGKATKAAQGFAKKIGVSVDALSIEAGYVQGRRQIAGKPAADVLPAALATIVGEIPFRKSMRWGSGDVTFGRPLRWLVALLDGAVINVDVPGIACGDKSYGHRFLHPGEVALTSVDGYVPAMKKARVIVDPAERSELMQQRLAEAARAAGGELIEDDFLVGENLSLVEDPQVVVGSFDDDFLELPEEVILEVARGHQRYFGMRDESGKLLAKYLAVVNTAERPEKIAQGNDRVMRARLADARFFYAEDLKHQLADRKKELAGIVFQARLGSVLDKVERIEKLVSALGAMLAHDARAAVRGAALAKCDLVTWMVGEFPELQGEVGRAYALKQGVAGHVADVIRDHYQPKGAKDDVAPTEDAALVALADRLDTLVGCFAIGLSPTGGADPYGLRRACIGTLRTVLHHQLDLSLSKAFAAAYAGFSGISLDLDVAALSDKLSAFFAERLRGLLDVPGDVIDAAQGAAADRPLDVRARAEAILALDKGTREKLGEVFKRATNIAKKAPDGTATRGDEPAEQALHDAFFAVKDELGDADYMNAFGKLASLADPLAKYFDDILVMHDDAAIRDNRLRLMRDISDTCSALAHLQVLGSV